MRIFALLLGAVILTGCAVTNSVIKSPPRGSVQTVGVGDVIYQYHEIMRDEYGTKKREIEQQLIYSGIANNQLRLVYREYIDDFARPAFSQDAQYDYALGMRVTFKGAMFRIVNASGQSITYFMEKGFTNELREEKS